jgi:hypothetical protein
MHSSGDGAPGRKYAVLINGHNWERYINNLSRAYRVLAQSGYREENIHVLDCQGKFRNTYPVHSLATINEIKKHFEHLSGIIGSHDQLFVYTTDHGDRTRILDRHGDVIEISTLRLLGENINEIEFADLLAPIKPRIGIFLFDQCHSGGFAQRIAGKNRVTISACSAYESSSDDTFPQAFFGAFLRNSGDTDNNGQVSIREAFAFALKHDQHALRGMQSPKIIYLSEEEAYL